jgi:hypothetical protein
MLNALYRFVCNWPIQNNFILKHFADELGVNTETGILDEKQVSCLHGHPPPNVFAHWKNVYVVEQNNSILEVFL